jgi:hypothetical protein
MPNGILDMPFGIGIKNVRQNMHFRFKGYGYLVLLVPIGGFLLFPPLVEKFLPGSEEAVRRHVNGIVLAFSGFVTFWIAAHSDKKSGIDVFARHAWTSDIMISSNICFNIPMRLFAVIMVVASLLF